MHGSFTTLIGNLLRSSCVLAVFSGAHSRGISTFHGGFRSHHFLQLRLSYEFKIFVTTPSHPQKFVTDVLSHFRFSFSHFTCWSDSHTISTSHTETLHIYYTIAAMQSTAIHPRLLLTQMICTAVIHSAVTPDKVGAVAEFMLTLLNILGAPTHLQPMLEGFWTCTATQRATSLNPSFFPRAMTDLAFPGMPQLPPPCLWIALQDHQYRDWIQMTLPAVLSTWAAIRESITNDWRPRRISNVERLVLRTVEDIHLVLQNLRDFLTFLPPTSAAQLAPATEQPAPPTPQQWLGTF